MIMEKIMKFFRRAKHDERNGIQKRFVVCDEKFRIRISPGVMQEIRLKPDDYVCLGYDDEKQLIVVEKTADVTNGFRVQYNAEYSSFIQADEFFQQFDLRCEAESKIQVDIFKEYRFEFPFVYNRKLKNIIATQIPYFVRFQPSNKQLMFSAQTAKFLGVDRKKYQLLKIAYDAKTNLITMMLCGKFDLAGCRILNKGKHQMIGINATQICDQMNWPYESDRIPVKLDKKNKSITFPPPTVGKQ